MVAIPAALAEKERLKSEHKMARLKASGVLWWHGYRLAECEGKTYSVSKCGVTSKVYEITWSLHKAYIGAFCDYGIRACQCARGSKYCVGTGDCTCKCFVWQ